jgi:predicted phosphodiesterase
MIGLIADVHGNIDALETVLIALADRGIEDIYAAGDLVGYNSAPNKCCKRLRAVPGVKGNHEWAARLDPDDEELVFINPGSVGQPRDGDPRAACAILDLATLQAQILRLDYDIGAAARRSRAAGLPPWLSDRLRQGR